MTHSARLSVHHRQPGERHQDRLRHAEAPESHPRRQPRHDGERGHLRPGSDFGADEKARLRHHRTGGEAAREGHSREGPHTAKYLNEFIRGKGKKAEGKTDTPPPPQA